MFIKSDIRKITIAVEKASGHEGLFPSGQSGNYPPGPRCRPREVLTDANIVAEESRTRDIISGAVSY